MQLHFLCQYSFFATYCIYIIKIEKNLFIFSRNIYNIYGILNTFEKFTRIQRIKISAR